MLVAFLIVIMLPAALAAQDARAISMAEGQCQLRLEANPQWNTLRLRAHNPAYGTCEIDKEAMIAALQAAFSKTDFPSADQGYTSLSIGRLIDYPWLSLFVVNAARNDPEFDLKKGKPRSKDMNKYVADLLRREEACKPLAGVLAGAGYDVVGVSVEKVLVGAAKDLPSYRGEPFSGRAPFDAQVWYRLKRR